MALYRFRATGTEDGHIESSAGTWAGAQAGSGTLTVTTSGNQVNVRTAATSITQGFGTWDTSSIGDSETCAWCVVKVSPPAAWSNTAHVKVGRYDWGASLTSADWRTTAQLTALDLFANVNMNGLESPGVLVQTLLWRGGDPASAVNKTGDSQFVVWLQQSEDASSPGSLSADTNGADAATDYNRTELIVATDGGSAPYPVATGRPAAVNTSSVNVVVPDIPDGHTGVIVVYGRGTKANDFTTPTDWTLAQSAVTDGTHGRLSVFTRKNTSGSTVSSGTVTVSYATSEAILGQAFVLARCDSVGAITTKTDNIGTTHTVPSVTTTAANSLVVNFIGGNDDPAFQYQNTSRFPIIMGAPVSTTLGLDAALAAIMVEHASAGATGTDTLVTSGSYRSVAISIEFLAESTATELTGTLFQKAPTFFTGTVAAGAVDLSGSLFQVAPTFGTGTVSSSYGLTGAEFTVAPTFFAGSTTGSQELTGALFQAAPTFPQGTVAPGAVGLSGSLFQVGPTFPQGAVTVGAVDLAGNLFVLSPTFFAGDTITAQELTGTLAQFAPTFFAGDITSTVDVAGSLFQIGPTFPQGAVTAGPVDLAGVLFQVGPSFFVANLSGGIRPRRRTVDVVGSRVDVSSGSGRVSTGVSVNRKTGVLE